MKINQTKTGKIFIWDRCRFVVAVGGLRYFVTASGNIIRENADGSFDEIPRAQVEANIMLLPYPIALELFPEWFAANPETI